MISTADSEIKYQNCYEAAQHNTEKILEYFVTMCLIIGVRLILENSAIISAEVERQNNSTLTPQDAQFLYFSINDYGKLEFNFTSTKPTRVELCIPLTYQD